MQINLWPTYSPLKYWKQLFHENKKIIIFSLRFDVEVIISFLENLKWNENI